MTAEEILFALLRFEICGEPVSEAVSASLSCQALERVYALAKKHDLAHLAGDALSKLGVLGEDEISQKLKQAAFQAVYRDVRLNCAYQGICKALEEAKISFIPLKGAVLRNHYPASWMRTSCDIDVLVAEEILETAAACLADKLGYVREGKGDHDISMFSPDGVHLELHYLAVDEGRMLQAQGVLGTIWEDAAPKTEGMYHHCMSDAMFYFYHIAHMAKHVENGGCGIRPFLDLWILNQRVAHDRGKRIALLEKGGLLTFAGIAEDLSKVWFSGGEKNEKSECFERFVLDGGIYGSLQNLVTVRQIQQGSKLKAAWNRIFLPYDKIKFYYPILQNRKWLTPVYQVVRWFKLVFKGGVRRSLRELKTNMEVSKQENEATESMLKYLGL